MSSIPPIPGLAPGLFPTEAAAHAYALNHAKQHGYRITVKRSSPAKQQTYYCCDKGSYQINRTNPYRYVPEELRKRQRTVRQTQCQFSVYIRYQKRKSVWAVTPSESHNHEPKERSDDDALSASQSQQPNVPTAMAIQENPATISIPGPVVVYQVIHHYGDDAPFHYNVYTSLEEANSAARRLLTDPSTGHPYNPNFRESFTDGLLRIELVNEGYFNNAWVIKKYLNTKESSDGKMFLIVGKYGTMVPGLGFLTREGAEAEAKNMEGAAVVEWVLKR